MAQSIDLTESAMLALTRDSLAALRGALFRDLGANGAGYLQEAGYAGGGALYDAFAHWLAARELGAPDSLPAEDFARYASLFFREAGWGSFDLGALHEAVATVDSEDWSEADPNSALQFPGCHLTTGLFADFFGRLAGTPMAAMEVECRSMGASRCRFLVGSGEVMQQLYDAMAHGETYEEAASRV